MTLFASVNQHRIRKGTLTVPAIGAWTADVETDDEIPDTEIAGVVTLGAGPISLVGRIYRAKAYAGSTRARLVGGGGGWSRPLPAKFYQHDAGVRLSLILNDAASALGETVAPVADRVLSNYWTRFASTGADLLYRLGLKWFVRPDGVTIIGERGATTVAAPFDVISYSADVGMVQIATEAIDSWVPGASFSSIRLPATFVVRDSVHHFEPSKVRTEAWVS